MNKLMKTVAGALAFSGMLTLLPVSAGAAPRVIKVTTHSSMSGSLCRSFVAMKRFIEERTDGKYRMDIYDSFKLGTMEEAYQGMGLGMVHFLAEGPSNIGTFMPELTMFDLGYLFPDADTADAVLSGPVGKKICAAAANNAVTPLIFVRYGFRNPFTNKPIQSLADLRGMKIRASSSPLHMAQLKGMGMNPIPMPGSEVYTGLQQGVIDGFDVDSPYACNSKWYEAAKSMVALNHTYIPQILYTSTKWWNRLPPEDKPIFEEAVQVFARAQRDNQREDEARAEKAFQDAGLGIFTPSRAELEALRGETADLYRQFPRIDVELLRELRAEVARVSSGQ